MILDLGKNRPDGCTAEVFAETVYVSTATGFGNELKNTEFSFWCEDTRSLRLKDEYSTNLQLQSEEHRAFIDNDCVRALALMCQTCPRNTKNR